VIENKTVDFQGGETPKTFGGPKGNPYKVGTLTAQAFDYSMNISSFVKHKNHRRDLIQLSTKIKGVRSWELGARLDFRF
jgi:hypothetical protein